MSDKPTAIDEVLAQMELVFPAEAEKISTVAFVHWHNIINHAALEGIDEKQLLFCAALLMALASNHFKLKTEELETIVKGLTEVSFEESIAFLSGKNKDSKK